MNEGKLQGTIFKLMMDPILSASSLFPHIAERVAQMDKDAWYDWDEFRQMITEIEAKLSPRTMRAIGFNVLYNLHPRAIEKGFTTSESILRDTATFWEAFAPNLPPEATIRTVEYAKGRAVLETGTLRPVKIVEGYVHGIIASGGGSLLELNTTSLTREGKQYYRIEATWI